MNVTGDCDMAVLRYGLYVNKANSDYSVQRERCLMLCSLCIYFSTARVALQPRHTCTERPGTTGSLHVEWTSTTTQIYLDPDSRRVCVLLLLYLMSPCLYSCTQLSACMTDRERETISIYFPQNESKATHLKTGALSLCFSTQQLN